VKEYIKVSNVISQEEAMDRVLEKILDIENVETTDDSGSANDINIKEETNKVLAELEDEKQKNQELIDKLAQLEEENKVRIKQIETDTVPPTIKITSIETKGKQAFINGIIQDNLEIAELTLNGNEVVIDKSGSFSYRTYVPLGGIEVILSATDISGLEASEKFFVDRVETSEVGINFAQLNPLEKTGIRNKDALALVIGIADYENAPEALYADRDAIIFRDYLSEILGIPDNRIKILINQKAREVEILLSIREWLYRSTKKNRSDIYIFFAGHGLASQDGKQLYLLPYDGQPRLLDKSAILRTELFSYIASAGPRSVTLFLDTCYSGATRGSETLIASRPISIVPVETDVPIGFTVFSAAASDQTSNPLLEAKQGMFSYFLMKGMEGEADINADNKITNRELHSYILENVIHQSSGSQTPQLQGDKDKVLVQW